MPSASIPWLLVFGLLSFFQRGDAQPFARICAIPKLAPVFAVVQNAVTNEYEFVSVQGQKGSADNSNRNLLRAQSTSTARITQEANSTTTPDPADPSYDLKLVRECPCALGTFCHIDLDTCGIPIDYSARNKCFAKSTKKTMLRNAWPLLMLWYSTILFFLMCTEKGRNARNFIILKVCKSNNNERIVDRFLYTHGLISTNPFSQDSPSQHPIDWLPIARPVEPREPTELVLKTRLFEPPPPDADVEEEDTTCTICFGTLEEGDRVGKLGCDHTFHVDCLREWLPRRNVCPLCQTSNAATPRYGDGTTATEQQANNGDDDNNEGDSTSDNNNATNSAEVELAPIETAVVEIEENRVAQLRRPNPNFAHQILGLTRI